MLLQLALLAAMVAVADVSEHPPPQLRAVASKHPAGPPGLSPTAAMTAPSARRQLQQVDGQTSSFREMSDLSTLQQVAIIASGCVDKGPDQLMGYTCAQLLPPRGCGAEFVTGEGPQGRVSPTGNISRFMYEYCPFSCFMCDGANTSVTDFDSINRMLLDFVLEIPDQPTVPATSEVDLELHMLTCGSMSVGAVTVSTVSPNRRQVQLAVHLRQVKLQCNGRMHYETACVLGHCAVKGSANVFVSSSGNTVDTVVNFASRDYNHYPPTSSSVGTCNAVINFQTIAYDGGTATSGVLSHLPDAVDRYIQSKVQTLAREQICIQVRASPPRRLEHPLLASPVRASLCALNAPHRPAVFGCRH